jgi:hypothetical protein
MSTNNDRFALAGNSYGATHPVPDMALLLLVEEAGPPT